MPRMGPFLEGVAGQVPTSTYVGPGFPSQINPNFSAKFSSVPPRIHVMRLEMVVPVAFLMCVGIRSSSVSLRANVAPVLKLEYVLCLFKSNCLI
jgi:hypothetical protein